MFPQSIFIISFGYADKFCFSTAFGENLLFSFSSSKMKISNRKRIKSIEPDFIKSSFALYFQFFKSLHYIYFIRLPQPPLSTTKNIRELFSLKYTLCVYNIYTEVFERPNIKLTFGVFENLPVKDFERSRSWINYNNRLSKIFINNE